jgi:tRNA (guanine-N7-)-methyltransferase
MRHMPHAQEHGRAFFGRRVARGLKPRQQLLLATILPQLRLDLAAIPRDLRSLYPQPVCEVRLEVGFGGGEHLIAEAKANPETGFIGVEPFVNGMAKTLAAITAENIANIRLHSGDAWELLPRIAQGALARLDLIQPDPWPKRRHWKRRFIQEHTIAEIGRVLRPGGEFRVTTDVADYAAWTLKHMLRSELFEWTAERANDWRRPWSGFPGTRYEAKARRHGREPCYLIFRRRPV